MNKITVHGNITATPELRHSRSGVPVATFTVATNRRRFDRQAGSWADLPSVFHRVVCFNALAENVAASLVKGTTVAVTGEFADDTYKREDGTTIRRSQIEASDVAASLRYATATVVKTRRNGQTPSTTGDHDTEPIAPRDRPARQLRRPGAGGGDAAPRPELTVVGSD